MKKKTDGPLARCGQAKTTRFRIDAEGRATGLARLRFFGQ